MKAYSMDLRVRVLADCDAGLGTMTVAQKYRVSDSWVRNLKRQRRETGEVGPRQQRVSHATKLDAHQERLRELVTQQPDATLLELQRRLGVSVAPATIWRTLRRLTFKGKYAAEQQLTFVAALRHEGWTAPLVLDGAMNGRAFLAYVRQVLAPMLSRGDMVILDNLSSHKQAGVRDANEACGASVVYLPPIVPT